MAGKNRSNVSLDGKVPFTVRVNKEVAECIKKYADAQKRAYGTQIELVLQDFFDRIAKERCNADDDPGENADGHEQPA